MKTPNLDNLINNLRGYERNDILSDNGKNQLKEYEAIKQLCSEQQKKLIEANVSDSLPLKDFLKQKLRADLPDDYLITSQVNHYLMNFTIGELKQWFEEWERQ